MTEHNKLMLERRKRWLSAVLVAILILILGASLALNVNFFTGEQTAKGKAQVASEQTLSLAEELQNACDSGKVVRSISGDNLCDRAAEIAQTPVSTEGPQGAQGPRGFTGAPGELGPVGPTGKTGDKGETGSAGSAGAAGIAGSQGLQGLQGFQGLFGQIGPAGADGATGQTGATGPIGPKGDTGDKGDPGATGEPGQDGDDGTSIESFSFTDQNGVAYSCEPNPPGSSAFSCTAEPTTVPTP